MFKNIIIGTIIALGSFFLVSCSTGEVKKESDVSWWGKTKCKLLKKNDSC